MNTIALIVVIVFVVIMVFNNIVIGNTISNNYYVDTFTDEVFPDQESVRTVVNIIQNDKGKRSYLVLDNKEMLSYDRFRLEEWMICHI